MTATYPIEGDDDESKLGPCMCSVWSMSSLVVFFKGIILWLYHNNSFFWAKKTHKDISEPSWATLCIQHRHESKPGCVMWNTGLKLIPNH